jgi:hypothetical protein
MNSDDDIRRLLTTDDAEPDAALDDRIRAAARAAADETRVPTDAPEPTASTRRRLPRWYVPASGIGAAAMLLLAVLVVQRAPEEATFSSEGAVPQRQPQEAPRAPMPAQPASAPQAPARADFQEMAEMQRSRRDAETSARTAAPRPAPPAAVADSAAVESAAKADAPLCPASSSLLRAGNIALCLGAGVIEVRQLPPGDCSEPLVIEAGAGSVSASGADSSVLIHLDGVPRWRVRCEDGAWQIAAP